MAAKTKIQWSGATWTPIRARNLATGNVGWHCTHVTPGCENCYAETLNIRLGTRLPFKPGHRKDVEIFLDDKMLRQPLSWTPRTIFVCSMTDLFADFVDDEVLDKMFAVMALTPQHTYQVLTKRPEHMRYYLTHPTTMGRWFGLLGQLCNDMHRLRAAADRLDGPLSNVWLGVSAEDQERANERIPYLLATPAATRFVSYEPAIGPVDFSPWICDNPLHEKQTERRVRLSGGTERRLGNPPGRDDLASEEPDVGHWPKKGSEHPVYSTEGGARHREVPSNPDHGQSEESQCLGASADIQTFPRADTRGDHSEPQGRQEEKQSPGQFGTGDLFGAGNSRCSRVGDGAVREPRWHEERHEQADAGSGGDYKESESGGREADGHSGRLRHQISAGIEDSSRRPLGTLDLIIIGGESGPRARPFYIDWAESLINQCKGAGIACFIKQLGAKPVVRFGGGAATAFELDDKKGGNMEQWPERLRVREMP